MATASGNRLTFITAEAVHAEMERLIPRFERQHGIDVDVNYDVNPAVAKRVMGDLARHLDRFGAQHYARRRARIVLWRRTKLQKRLNSTAWRATRNKTANSYTIEIAI